MLALLLAASLLHTISLEGDTHHVQGIAVDEGRLFVTSVDRAARKGFLSEYDLTSGRLLRCIEIQQGDLFHPGGFDVDDTSLWIPVAEYRPNSRAVIQRRSRQTLQLLSSFPIPDHIGALAVAESTLTLANWDSRAFYTCSFDGKILQKRPNPNPTSYQDIKFRYGTLIASGLYPKPRKGGAVEWLDPETLTPLQSIPFGLTDRGTAFTHEGMDLRDNLLYLLPEDSPSRLFVFSLD